MPEFRFLDVSGGVIPTRYNKFRFGQMNAYISKIPRAPSRRICASHPLCGIKLYYASCFLSVLLFLPFLIGAKFKIG